MPVDRDRHDDVDRPVRDLTIADLDVDGVDEYNGIPLSRGPLRHSATPSMTLSVMVEMVCFDTSARCAAISPWVQPLADSDSTMSSTPVRHCWRLRTICGSPPRRRRVEPGPRPGRRR